MSIINDMNLTLTHRGPDAESVFNDAYITLGHRLLSIRDATVKSKQPATDNDSPWVVMLDGEIYNTDAIKSQLPASYRGCQLDTTLLFGLINVHGWNFIHYIQGMFSIVVYNSDEKIVRLYRDASGQKSLCYYQNSDHFTFSSELRSLLKNPQVIKTVDSEAVELFSQIGYLPGYKTLIQNVHKVDPAEIVTCNFITNTIYTEQFDHSSSLETSQSFGDAADQLIQLHAQARSNFSLNLSGGIDSTFLLHLFTKHQIPITTFTTSFGTSNKSADTILAKRLASDFGVTHHEVHVNENDYCTNMLKAYAVIEEPNCSFSIPVYYTMAAHHKALMPNNRVIFSGDGGDEVFGGYEHYLMALAHPHNDTDYLSHPGIYYNYYPSSYVDQSFLRKSNNSVSARAYVTQMISKHLSDTGTNLAPILLSMKIDRLIWLAGQTFIRNDKTYLHHGLEIRNPFAYTPYQNYIDATVHGPDYINNKENKVFLRNYLHNKVPDYISRRTQKTGWDAPIEHLYGPRTREIFQSIIGDAAVRHSQQLNWSRARDLLNSHTTWPGRAVQGMISLAIVADYLDINL